MKKDSSFLFGNKFFVFLNILIWLTVFTVFFTSSISNLDPDFSWHLRIGQDILINKQVPHTEKYIFTTLGERWVDHEWLSNLLLFSIYDFFGKFGYWALGVLFAGIATYTLFLISRLNRKYFLTTLNNWSFLFLNSVFLGLGLLSLLRTYGIRLQVLTWLFFVLLFVFYFKLLKERKILYLLAYPLLFCFWANLHGTFVFGLFIAIGLLFFLLWQKKERVFREKVIITILATLISTLITPYGLELWKLIIVEYTQNSSYLLQIFEWLPLYAAPFIEWYSTFYISISLFIFLAAFKFGKIPKKQNFLFYYGFFFFILLMSVKARRFVSMFVLCSFPLVVFSISKIFKNLSIKKSIRLIPVFFLIPLLVYKFYFISTVPLNLLTQNTVASPYNAVTFIKEDKNINDLRVYNKYGWGGYLVWMWPEKLHFIDGRMPQKPLQNNLSLIEEYFKFQENTDLAKEKLAEYNIKVVLLETNYKISTMFSPTEKWILQNLFSVNLAEFDQKDSLREFLDTNWTRVYTDEISVVYISPEIKH